MHVVLYDFTPIADTLMGELTQLNDACVAYENLIDLLLVSRLNGDPRQEDYLVDVLCDKHELDIHDRQLVRSAYYRLKPCIAQILPPEAGAWLCCGFIGTLGYFIHDAVYHPQQFSELHQMVKQTLQSSRGYYDSGLQQQHL